MKVLVLVLMTACAAYADTEYAHGNFGGYINLETPYKGCHYVGQYLKHPKDECKFLRCDYGKEPWKGPDGKILLFAREMRCANGLSVGYGYEHGYDNPCNTPNKKCFVYPTYKEHGYDEVSTKDVYDSYNDDHKDGYGKNQGYETYQTYDTSYDQGYDHKDQGYGKQNLRYGHQDRGYGKQNRGYAHESQGYGKQKQVYGKHDQGYGKQTQRYDSYNSEYASYDSKNVYDNKNSGYEQKPYGGDNRRYGYDREY